MYRVASGSILLGECRYEQQQQPTIIACGSRIPLSAASRACQPRCTASIEGASNPAVCALPRHAPPTPYSVSGQWWGSAMHSIGRSRESRMRMNAEEALFLAAQGLRKTITADPNPLNILHQLALCFSFSFCTTSIQYPSGSVSSQSSSASY